MFYQDDESVKKKLKKQQKVRFEINPEIENLKEIQKKIKG